MPTPVDPKRLPRLRAALKKFKPAEKVPQQDLAKVYGVTNARLTTLIHQRFEGFPKPERRGDKTHWYEARAAIEAMIAYLTASTSRKVAAARRTAEVLGAAAEESSTERQPLSSPPAEAEKPQPLGPAEIDKLASAATRIFRLEQEKKQFIRVDSHRSVVRKLFTTVQRSVSGLATEIDPNGELPPMQRQRLELAIRDAMVRIHGSVAVALDDQASARL